MPENLIAEKLKQNNNLCIVPMFLLQQTYTGVLAKITRKICQTPHAWLPEKIFCLYFSQSSSFMWLFSFLFYLVQSFFFVFFVFVFCFVFFAFFKKKAYMCARVSRLY